MEQRLRYHITTVSTDLLKVIERFHPLEGELAKPDFKVSPKMWILLYSWNNEEIGYLLCIPYEDDLEVHTFFKKKYRGNTARMVLKQELERLKEFYKDIYTVTTKEARDCRLMANILGFRYVEDVKQFRMYKYIGENYG